MQIVYKQILEEFIMKKLLALLLAIALCTTFFVSCSDAPASESTPDSSSAATDTDDSEDSEPEEAGEPTTISWMVRTQEPANVDSVFEAINAKLLEDINMQLDMVFIAPGDYEQRMQLALAGGDDWDLCFTSHWANNYVNGAGKGAYLPLDDLLAENAPNHMSEIPEQFWDGIKVNGNIYGMINYQVMFDQAGVAFLKDIVDDLELDVESIASWDDMTAVLQTVKEAYPDVYPTRGNGVMNWALAFQDPHISAVFDAPYLAFDSETMKIDNDLYFERIADGLAASILWREEELVPADAATLKDETTLINSGMMFSRYNRVKPGGDVALANQTGLEWVVVPTSYGVIGTSAVQSTLTAVNANSENPEKAIQLYDYFFSNKDAFNMLIFGLEGQDYEIVNGDRVKKIDSTYSAPAWMLGNQFNAMLLEADVATVWEDTKKANEEAVLDVLYGFVPDRTPIETELANCEAIWTEYKDILYYGLRPTDEVLVEMMDKFDAAGLEAVTAELQSQVDAFFAAK